MGGNPFQRAKIFFGCRFGDFVLIPTYEFGVAGRAVRDTTVVLRAGGADGRAIRGGTVRVPGVRRLRGRVSTTGARRRACGWEGDPPPGRRGRGCSTASPRGAWPRARCRSSRRGGRRPRRRGYPPISPRAYDRRGGGATPASTRRAGRSSATCCTPSTFAAPPDFAPRCADGEVASFECLPVAELVSLVRRHADEVQFKPNVAVVFIDLRLAR